MDAVSTLVLSLNNAIRELAISKAPVPENLIIERDASVARASQFILRIALKVISLEGKAELIETHYNWFVTVEPDSGEYFIDKNMEAAWHKCREKHPGKIHHTFRINETGTCGTI
ncbi:hypothetical protein RIVM261_076150 [Rivularia sp. IAM M-261]|nr:hypothetical protein RIVM261_076150 [Rivularia sp. IAM M-261]